MSSPPLKRPRIDPPDADTVDATVSDRPSSTANKTVVTSGSQPAERVNPVFGPGYATKFDKFSLLPRIVREAVYSSVDWDTSRALPVVIPETEQYYARRPYKMEMVTLKYTPDTSYLPFSDISDFVIDYHRGPDLHRRSHDSEIHTLGLQEFDWVPGFRSRFDYKQMRLPEGCELQIVRYRNSLLHSHKLCYIPNVIYFNFDHVSAEQITVHAISFFADTPSGLLPLRHGAARLCLVFEDPDLDLVNNLMDIPLSSTLRCLGTRLNVNMRDHPELVVSGTRDWLRFVQPSDGLEMTIGYVMTVPAGIFNLHEVRSAREVVIVSNVTRTKVLSGTKIDITITQLRTLSADFLHFGFVTPSITASQLLSFVMDKLKTWIGLGERDRRSVLYFMFTKTTVEESEELMFLSELHNLVVGDRFKVHSVDGVWIRGKYVSALRASIVEDTKLRRHLLVRCGADNVVSIYNLYPCLGYTYCQCVIGLGPCKPAVDTVDRGV